MTVEDSPQLVVRRLLSASRERVFAAWLDPAMLVRFMRPGSVKGATVEVDPRVGGRFRIVMHDDEDCDHHGEYLVIDPPSKLSFTWISENTDHRESVVTIELFDRAGKTELVLSHQRLPPTRVPAHSRGWTDIVHELETALEA